MTARSSSKAEFVTRVKERLPVQHFSLLAGRNLISTSKPDPIFGKTPSVSMTYMSPAAIARVSSREGKTF
jgi:hypothetical protein